MWAKKRKNGMVGIFSTKKSGYSIKIKIPKMYDSHSTSVPKAFRTVRFDFYVMRKFDRS